MAKLFALKSFVGTPVEAREDGSILQIDHEVHYKKGDYIFTSLEGKQSVIPKDLFTELYIEVKEIKRVNKKYTYEQFANGYGEMDELEEDCNKLMFDTDHYPPHSEWLYKNKLYLKKRDWVLVIYDSMTGNVQRFISSLEIHSIKIHDGLLIKEPFILVTYCTGFGQIPKLTAEFLKSNSDYLKGVAVSGNKNWGEFYGKSGETISNYYNVPLIMKFEMSGTKKERDNFIMEVKQFDNINS